MDHLRSDCEELLSDLTNNDRKVDGDLEVSIKDSIEGFKNKFS